MADNVITPEQAQAVLDAKNTEDERACLAEIQVSLAKFGCELRGYPSYTPDGRTVVNVVVGKNNRKI